MLRYGMGSKTDPVLLKIILFKIAPSSSNSPLDKNAKNLKLASSK